MTFSLLNAYLPCDDSVHNTTATSYNTDACAPAVHLDDCAFGPTGHGTLTIRKIGSVTKGNEDIKLTAIATGLTNCEGENLHIRLSYRLTTDDCGQAPCTTIDINDWDLEANGAFCIVTNGKCKIDTKLSLAAPGLFGSTGKNAGVTILGCGLHAFGMGASPSPLECGILLK